MLHPVGHERTAAAHDAGDTLADKRHMLAHHAGVNGHVVDALLGLFFDYFEHQVEGEIFGAADAGNGFVYGDGADRNGRSVDNGFADGGDVAAGGEVHHGIRAVVDRVVELFQLFINIGTGGGISDICVDLAFGGDADGHRFEVAVMNIGGGE